LLSKEKKQKECANLNGPEHTRTHIHFTALWTLSGITWVSRYQKQSGFYWSKRQSVAVGSAGPYANLHLTSDR